MMNTNYSLVLSLFWWSYIGRVRELEEKRINKEMANIRSKFKGTEASTKDWMDDLLTPYKTN